MANGVYAPDGSFRVTIAGSEDSGAGAAAEVQGNVASGATDSGNPVKIGAIYNASALPAFTNGQRGDCQIDANGNLRAANTLRITTGADAVANTTLGFAYQNTAVGGALLSTGANFVFNGTSWDRQRGSADAGTVSRPYALPASDWNYAAATGGIVNTTTAVTIKAAAGASVRNYITSIQVQTATLGGATELAIRDGAAGTVLWRTQLQTTAMPLVTIVFPTPLKSTANTLLEVVTLTAVTGGVFVNAQGYTAP